MIFRNPNLTECPVSGSITIGVSLSQFLDFLAVYILKIFQAEIIKYLSSYRIRILQSQGSKVGHL